MRLRPLITAALILFLTACSSWYYGAWEKLGVPKREIMVERVKKARETQNETKAQFLSALEQFKGVIAFKGGDLEKEYGKLNATLKKCESKAGAVHRRIRSVENVSEELFKEWDAEIAQYSSDVLRKKSQEKYDLTKLKYTEFLKAMKKAESRLEPALAPLRDQVLFMKHNLNAKAIAGLGDERVRVETNVDQLVKEMEGATAQADSFIASLQEK